MSRSIDLCSDDSSPFETQVRVRGSRGDQCSLVTQCKATDDRRLATRQEASTDNLHTGSAKKSAGRRDLCSASNKRLQQREREREGSVDQGREDAAGKMECPT